MDHEAYIIYDIIATCIYSGGTANNIYTMSCAVELNGTYIGITKSSAGQTFGNHARNYHWKKI